MIKIYDKISKQVKRYPLGKCVFMAKSLFPILGKKETIYLSEFFAQGSSTLVYKGQCKGKNCIVKELFPEGLVEKQVLMRKKNGGFSVNVSIKNFWVWSKEKKRFKKAVKLYCRLQKLPNMLTQITHFYGLYKANGTLYLISDETGGRSWDTITGESIECIISICSLIAQITEELHQAGWLVVDIKASNYIVIKQNSVLPKVKMIDFDSIISQKKMNKLQQYRCSSETAPPELLLGIHKNVGVHSDVYSIVAMLFCKLTQKKVTVEWPQVYDRWEKEKLCSWNAAQKKQLREIMEKALDVDVRKRMRSCRELADALESIINERGISYENL